jgi:hypothetical protein
LLIEAWAAIYDQSFALDQIRSWNEDWWKYDPSRLGRAAHLGRFLITYSAELALFEKASRLSRLLLANDSAKRFLDTPHPTEGLGPSTFSLYRQELVGARDHARIEAGAAYLEFLDTGMKGEEEAKRLGLGWLWAQARLRIAQITQAGFLERAETLVRGDTQIIKRVLKRSWYPAQAGVAEWAGDTRVRRHGSYLISPEQIDMLDPELEPGDILLSRKNWYLSNVGLPGFWPHAILYVGSPDKLKNFFDDAEVNAWVEQVSGQKMSFLDYLTRQQPAHGLKYLASQDGHAFTIIEAVSEGVLLNDLYHAGDYLAALRPKRSKLAKAQAILAAFQYLDRPYDFDFDFTTDHALVCSEVTWRAWRPAIGKEGLDIPTVSKAGRLTLPANEYARFYAQSNELDFVAFLEAIEAEGKAVRSDEAAFRESWKRIKWDVAQK